MHFLEVSAISSRRHFAGLVQESLRIRKISEAWEILKDNELLQLSSPVDTNLQRSCRSRLKQIGLAVMMYRHGHNDRLPDFGTPGFFEALCEIGFVGKDVFLCPAVDLEEGGGEEFHTHYETWSKGTLGSVAAYRFGSRIPLAWDRQGNHADHRNVLFLDGHAVGMSEEEFRELMKLEGLPEDLGLER